jgi:hypothetical protein
VGTTDIDICLSVALAEGDTAEYERIEVALKAAGYVATDDSFRWKRATGLGLNVESFGCHSALGHRWRRANHG